MKREIRRVEVFSRREQRKYTFEVFAKKDPVRAARRTANQMRWFHQDFDWANAEVKIGRTPRDAGPELDSVDADVLRGIMSGEYVTETIV